MEFKITSREWRVRVRLAPGEAPDFRKSLSGAAVRPEQLNLTFREDAAGQVRASAVVTGRRVLKDGGLGAEVRDEAPPAEDWLRDIISQARMRLPGLERRT